MDEPLLQKEFNKLVNDCSAKTSTTKDLFNCLEDACNTKLPQLYLDKEYIVGGSKITKEELHRYAFNTIAKKCAKLLAEFKFNKSIDEEKRYCKYCKSILNKQDNIDCHRACEDEFYEFNKVSNALLDLEKKYNIPIELSKEIQQEIGIDLSNIRYIADRANELYIEAYYPKELEREFPKGFSIFESQESAYAEAVDRVRNELLEDLNPLIL